MPRPSLPKIDLHRLAACAILLLMFGLAVHSMVQKSPAFDEQSFVVRGLGYLRGENRHMRVGHPLGLNALNAAFLVNDPTVALPTEDPSWLLKSFHRPAELFLWEIGNSVEHVMFLARLPSVFLGMGLAALAYRWTFDAGRNRLLALLALAFVAFDPNVLANTRLTTTDIGVTAGALLAGYTLWRYLTVPTLGNVLLAGLGFGLLNNTKFTAGLYVPLFALAIVGTWLLEASRDGLRTVVSRHAKFVLLFPLSSFVVLWACYGFEIGTLPDSLPALPQLSGLTLPLAHHLEQLLDIGNRSTKGAAAFLLGDYSRDGWWYYFPVAFALKTPLATLGLIGLGFVAMLRKENRSNVAIFLLASLIPSLGFLALGMTTSVNLGYRHILPIVPYLVVFACVMLARWLPTARPFVARGVGVLAAALVLATGSVAPHYLAFFNSLAGGPDNGWRSLVDSNIDWGQDLAELARWIEANEDVDSVWLSYFGESRPDYYGIPYRGLDSIPPRLMSPDFNPLYPHNPAPGIYAISATNLQGVLFADTDQFAWFREREPFAKIGYSIFLYEVEATGPQVAVQMPENKLQDVPPEVMAQLGTNDIRPIFYTPNNSQVTPANGSFAIGEENGEWFVFEQSAPAVVESERIEMGIWSLLVDVIRPKYADGQLTVTTVWEVAVPSDAALRIFVHALDANDNIIAQSDALTVHVPTLANGDIVQQQYTIDTPTAPTALRIGLYDWQTGQRFGEPVVMPMP